MGEYSAKIDFQTVVACKEALEVYKAILEAQSVYKAGLKVQLKSDYELNIEYKRICDAYDKICSKL